MFVQNNRISEQHEKIIEEFKYLLPLEPKLVTQDLLGLLNRLNPFLQFPLDTPPPIQFFQVQQQNKKVITEDLKTQLKSYCFILLRGSLIVSKQNYQFTQQKYLDDQNIRQKSVYNFEEGKSKLTASTGSVYLKIHSVWIKKAKKKHYDRERQFIKNKLISFSFFSQLTFQQFSQCCQKAYLLKLGPEQILIKQQQIPYHMYIVAQGELCLQKRVKFSKQTSVWNSVKTQIKKNDDFCEELFEYLIRDPAQGKPFFQVDFNLKQIHQGQIICAKQTLLEQQLQFTIRSTLKAKIICIKYPDLYVLNEDRLMQMRNWPYICQIDKKQLRRQYYSLMNWLEFKQFLQDEKRLSQVQKQSFESYLRKSVNLNSKRYNYCSHKVGDGKITESPAGKVLKMRKLSTAKNLNFNIQ